MGTNVVSQKTDRFKQILQSDSFRAEVAAALPRHIRPERFQRVLLTSVINDERLLNVQPIKVVRAALQVAPLGLLTDKLLGEAALVVDGKQEVQVRVMYRGLLKLMRQSGDVASAFAHEICKNDKVRVLLGTEKKLEHEPAETSRGEITRYYAVVKYKSGDVDFEIMTIEEINRIRDRSDAWKAYRSNKIKDTPWASHPEEMAKKTVLRRLLKRVPASPDLADALRLEEAADQQEYGSGSRTALAAPVAMGPESEDLSELLDQYGEVFMLTDGEIGPWLQDTAAGCSSDEDLGFLVANNPERADVRAAVERERASRTQRSSKQGIQEAPMKQMVKIVDLDGNAVTTTSLGLEAWAAYEQAKKRDPQAVALRNIDALTVMAAHAKGGIKTKIENDLAMATAVLNARADAGEPGDQPQDDAAGEAA